MSQSWGAPIGLVVVACLAPCGASAQIQASPEQPAAASNITSYKPEFFSQFRPNTALDMITRIPGFAFEDSGDGRGFAGNAGNVLIDGERPPSRSDSLGSAVGRIPATGVERIDIIRGGADGIDMQGRAIIANIIRKADAGVTGAFSASANVNDAGDVSPNATLQLRNQAGEQLLEGSVSVNRNEGSNENAFTRLDLAGNVLRDGRSTSESEFNRIAATGVWETTFMGGKLRLNALANASKVTYGSASAFAIPGGGQGNTGAETDVEGEAGIRFTRTLDGGFGLELVGFQSLNASENRNDFSRAGVVGQADFTSGSRSESRGGESIIRASLQLPPATEWSFEGGGEVVFNFSERDNAFSFNGAPFGLGGDRNNVEELRTDGFVAATWKPSPQMNLEAGSRFEWSRITADSNAGVSEKSLTYVKPRLNASWTPEQGTQVGLRFERNVDQLDFDSFASSAAFEEEIFGIGNLEAEPEKIWETELRYERQFGGQNSLLISYTHKLVEDVLGRAVVIVPGAPPDPDREFEITRNGDQATIGLLNLSGSVELDSWGLPGGILSGSSTLIDSEVTDPVTGETRAADESNAWAWNINLQQTLGNGDFRWNVFIQDESAQQEWEPHYINRFASGTFLGAGLTWKPWPGWTFGAGLNNLIAEDSSARFDFFDAVRTVGALPTYRETNLNRQKRNLSLSVRRNF